MADLTDRMPPCNLEAEMSLLGATMQSDEVAELAARKLGADDFYDLAHRKVFAAVQSLKMAERPVDPVTVAEALCEKGELDAIGGAVYLAKLDDSVPTTAHAGSYLRIVLEKSALRKTITACQEIQQACYDQCDLGEVIGMLEPLPERLRLPTEKLYDRQASMDKAIAELEARGEAEKHLPTGLGTLDEPLGGGLLPGEMLVIGGYPGMGKTSLALWMMRENLRLGHTCLVLSYEMSESSLIHRMMGQATHIPGWKFRKGKKHILPEEWHALMEWCGQNLHIPWYIFDDGSLTAPSIPSQVYRYKPNLVFLDFLQLVPKERSARGAGHEQIEATIQTLLQMARRGNMGLVLLSQLSRPEGDSLPRPKMHQLKGSSAIEQAAHAIVFIHRELLSQATGEQQTLVSIAKNRSGEVLPWAPIYFDAQTMTFGKAETRLHDDTGDDDLF